MKVIFGIVFLCLLSYGCIDNQDSKYVACVADDTKTNMSNGFRNVLDSLIRKEIATDALIASKQNYTPYPVYNLIIVDDSVNKYLYIFSDYVYYSQKLTGYYTQNSKLVAFYLADNEKSISFFLGDSVLNQMPLEYVDFISAQVPDHENKIIRYSFNATWDKIIEFDTIRDFATILDYIE